MSMVPLYWGERDDPRRREIGTADVDTETGKIDAVITDADAIRWVSSEINQMTFSFSFGTKRPHYTTEREATKFVENASSDVRMRIKAVMEKIDEIETRIDQLHGLGAVGAIEAAYKDGSVFNE